MACPVFALDFEKSARKFADGAMETVKSPIALHDHTKGEMEKADHMAKKAGHGMLEMNTFPIEKSQLPNYVFRAKT